MIRWLGFWVATTVATAASIILLWWTDVPLGVPGEWAWDRIASTHPADVLLGWTQAAIAAAFYLVFVWLGTKRLASCSGVRVGGWLIGLTAMGFAWLCVLQESPPVNHSTSKTAWVLYYPGSSGYFQVARYQMPDVATFLEGYQDLMAEGDVFHIGTHPPGLILFHRMLIELCRRSQGLTNVLWQTQPQSLRDAFAAIAETTRETDSPLLPGDQAPIWLAALITQFAAVATMIPLYFLLRRHSSRVTSWMAVSFWPMFPAVAIFLPKSDLLYPGLAFSFLVFWLEGFRRSSALMCVTAGCLLWLGMLLSLAFLPIILLACLLVLGQVCGSRRDLEPCRGAARRAGIAVAWTVSTIALLSALLWFRYDLNLLSVWFLNFCNHAEFYHVFPRTYWIWLLANPIEFTLAAGVPIVMLASRSLLSGLWNTLSLRNWTMLASPLFGCSTVWLLLWISGKNMGEAARLWTLLMPCLIWMTPHNSEQLQASNVGEQHMFHRTLWLALILQAVVCIATVTRVDGFQLSQFVEQSQKAGDLHN